MLTKRMMKNQHNVKGQVVACSSKLFELISIVIVQNYCSLGINLI